MLKPKADSAWQGLLEAAPSGVTFSAKIHSATVFLPLPDEQHVHPELCFDVDVEELEFLRYNPKISGQDISFNEGAGQKLIGQGLRKALGKPIRVRIRTREVPIQSGPNMGSRFGSRALRLPRCAERTRSRRPPLSPCVARSRVLVSHATVGTEGQIRWFHPLVVAHAEALAEATRVKGAKRLRRRPHVVPV